MTRRPTDLEGLRRALRGLTRGNLLIIAERATELVARTKLKALLADFVHFEAVAKTTSGPASFLDEVRKFHAASMGGQYYEAFDVNSKNFMEKSSGTEAFIAEFERLVGQCVRTAEAELRSAVREAFEILFKLLRHIDEGNDDIIFFADEGGSWEVGVDLEHCVPRLFPVLGRDCFCRTVRASCGPSDHGLFQLRAATPFESSSPRREYGSEGGPSCSTRGSQVTGTVLCCYE